MLPVCQESGKGVHEYFYNATIYWLWSYWLTGIVSLKNIPYQPGMCCLVKVTVECDHSPSPTVYSTWSNLVAHLFIAISFLMFM